MGIFSKLLGKGEYEALVERAMAELQIKTAAMDSLFSLAEADWDVDQEQGTIEFTAPDGTVARCSVQIIGTYSTVDGTWLWGWDHPAVAENLSQAAKSVRQWGLERGVAKLTKQKLKVGEKACWEFVAAACHLTGAQGAYRGPSGDARVFMTFDDVHVSKEASGSDESAPAGDPAEGLSDDFPGEARAVVVGFLGARHQWEKAAAAHDSDDEDDDFAVQTYAALLQEWCSTAVKPQGCNYGSPPDWDPDATHVLGGVVEDDGRCRMLVKDTTSEWSESLYEVHLVRDGSRWVIASFLYVDGDERLESL